jgi:biopolymer transport protein ExbB
VPVVCTRVGHRDAQQHFWMGQADSITCRPGKGKRPQPRLAVIEARGDPVDSAHLLELLQRGGLTVYPLAVASVLVFAVFLERLWRYRGVTAGTRALTREVIEALVNRNMDRAKTLCEKSTQPIAKIFLEAMRWKNVALEDLERVLATSRQEAATDLKRGVWIVGTIGSLAPYVGLFGTVVGIIRAFQDMAEHGAGGFEVVAAGISEALVATAAGLAVAILALLFYNYLQTRAGAIAGVHARACERFLQALLFVETASADQEGGPHGQLVPAR